MRESLLKLLVDPLAGTPLSLESSVKARDEVFEGLLLAESGESYPIVKSIPRFVQTTDAGQRQTGESFGFKWRQRDIYDAAEPLAFGRDWLCERYGFTDAEEMRNFFGRRKRILDAGCGAGYSTSCWMDKSWRGISEAEWVGADISTGIDVARDRLGSLPGTHFVQADLLHLPFQVNSFDAIFSEGVLHHTPSTELAFRSLVPLLERGGEFLFYIYRKKGPVREFTDDFVRDVIAGCDPKTAWQMLRPLTKLGQALAELNAEVEVPEDIPYLNIKAGRYDVQRLVYWHFAKLYWNDRFTFEQNNHANFDWYHPRYAHRHTEDEIRRWCDESAITITHFNEQESGFTVRGVKN